MRACSHTFNLSLSSSYSEISESFSDKQTGVAEAVNDVNNALRARHHQHSSHSYDIIISYAL